MRYKAIPPTLRYPRPERDIRIQASTPPQRAWVNWLGSLIMVGLLPALILPLLFAQAATDPALLLNPGVGPAGSTITVVGANFAPGLHGQMLVDGASSGLPRFHANKSGQFSVSLTVPGAASPGGHLVQAATAPRGPKKASPASILASSTFTVQQVATPAPTPAQTPAPTPAPTARPTPTPPPAATPSPTPSPTPTPTPTPSPTPAVGSATLVGAGDIAACTSSGDEATAALLDQIAGTVFTTGDNVYDNGTASEFQDCYGPSWGRHKARTRPTPGNHDWNTANAQGYRDYFGFPTTTYYSYNLGAWHVVVLDSDCSQVGGCASGSAQYSWLATDLTANARACTVAMWHHPRFSSGEHGNSTAMQAIWQLLYDRNAELVLTGHDHTYERFAPQTASGGTDTARGLREFVVGTGGRNHYAFVAVQPNSEARNADTFGVLKLTLRADGYDWQFVPEAGKTFTDAGTGSCH